VPQTPLGELTAPLAVFKGPTSKGGREKGRKKSRGREGEGNGRGERPYAPSVANVTDGQTDGHCGITTR